MSRAEVTWAGSVRHEALRKLVLVMPSAWARAVIFLAKPLSRPARCSPMAQATSFADFVTRARIASRALIVPPALMPSFDGAWPAQREDILILVLRLVLPLSIDSNSM